jgi:hypothetical protein
MKLIVTFVLLTLAFVAYPKATLTIEIKNCRKAEFAYLAELKILKNGVLYKTLKPMHDTEQKLKNLEPGTYTLVYQSIFGKEVVHQTKITENKNYPVVICIDFLDYSKETYKPIIDQLQNGTFYEVLVASQGCFHSRSDAYTIKKSADGYSIEWKGRSKQLNDKDLEAIRRFEYELHYANSDGCTTVDAYTVKYQGKETQTVDGGCDWDGFYNLEKKIFPK